MIPLLFGDGRNDIEMIEETGQGIAMGNAVPELKSVAKYITTNIEEEGITALHVSILTTSKTNFGIL